MIMKWSSNNILLETYYQPIVCNDVVMCISDALEIYNFPKVSDVFNLSNTAVSSFTLELKLRCICNRMTNT